MLKYKTQHSATPLKERKQRNKRPTFRGKHEAQKSLKKMDSKTINTVKHRLLPTLDSPSKLGDAAKKQGYI